MGKHILVISQYFYPEEFRINDICEEWVKRGYEVTVVTGIPNYPQGRFFDGYGWGKKRKEVYKGIRIVRLPIIPRGERAATLILNYFSFVASGFFWKVFTGIRADKVFVFEVSPMTQALPGVWYARKRKIPCYIYVQDLWPENVEFVAGIHNRRVIGAIDKMVNYIYRNCTGIFATSPSFVRKIEERGSAWNGKNSKVVYWPQYAEEFYRPMGKKVLEKDACFQVVFTGNIGYAQGLDILPATAEILKKKGIGCRFMIVGDGRYREELEREIASRNVADMFLMPGRKPPREIPEILAGSDVAYISFANNLLFENTIPAKLQSYMACGIPILASATGETKRIIDEARCGIACKMGDCVALAEGIEHFMEMPWEERSRMGQNALGYSERHFNKRKLLDEMERYVG
ncbi:MAG: glycosyltransferase family 4 protein [Blautia sp.]|nr:glycosyltransferase family 4 protein [Blautia sp.]